MTQFCPVCKYQLQIVRVVEGKAGVGFFECKSCEHVERIPNGTVVIETAKTKKTEVDPRAVHLDNYPRKIIKRCKNASCPRGENVEVVVWKDEDFHVLYVCTACSEVMNPTSVSAV